MATVFDVAKYILHEHGRMTAMKLQKLCYYAQAWSLVWDEKPLFRAEIEAWANGPVVPRLYAAHRGMFEVTGRGLAQGDRSALNIEQQSTVNSVLKYYGSESSQWLSRLTHEEQPWRNARNGLKPGERGKSVISHAAMHEYYDSL